MFGGTANISDGSTIIFNNVVSGVTTASAPAISSNTTYTLTATNISNASTTATQNVTVTAGNPTAQLTASSYSLNNDESTITLYPVFSNGTPTISWSGSGTILSGNQIQTNGSYIVSASVGLNSYTLSVTNETTTVSDTIEVTRDTPY